MRFALEKVAVIRVNEIVWVAAGEFFRIITRVNGNGRTYENVLSDRLMITYNLLVVIDQKLVQFLGYHEGSTPASLHESI
jgi:hypothetical protein